MTKKETECLIHKAANEVAEKEDLAAGVDESSPVVFSPQHKKRMQKLFKSRRKWIFIRSGNKKFYKRATAMVVLAAALALLFAIPSVYAMREQIIGFILEKSKPFSLITYPGRKDNDAVMQSEKFKFKYIPGGYNVKSEKTENSSLFYHFASDAGNGLYFYVVINLIPDFTSIRDEGSASEGISINGHEAVLTVNDDSCIIIWIDGVYEYQVIGNLDQAELIKIAKNLYRIS